MNTKVKIHLKVVKANDLLIEIPQHTACLFSYVVEKEDGFHQIIPPVKCRDFLGDLLWSRATGRASCIYGLTYDYSTDPYDTERLALSIKFPDEATFENFKNNALPFIHKKETKAKVETPTTFVEATDDLTLVVLADKVWQSAIWKLSLYTFYLKCCCYADPAQPTRNTVEYEYKQELTTALENKFLKAVQKEFLWFPPYLSTAHNNSGFLSIIKMQNYLGGDYYDLEHENICRTILQLKKTKKETV